ncbi:hypothetical protein [Isoptericola aurantiacus]|uniref:hypothetical protein n=1 Tax=Isoptericola aurantiacus TaxID=3377839 RepID=UPI00383A3EB2
MQWWGCVLVAVGSGLAVRAAWTARRAGSATGAHGLAIALGVSLAFWGSILGVVGLLRDV